MFDPYTRDFIARVLSYFEMNARYVRYVRYREVFQISVTTALGAGGAKS